MDVDSIPVLELDPDLAGSLSDEDRRESARVAIASGTKLEPGPWSPAERWDSGHMGLLVLEGMLTRVIEIRRRRSVELLGRGDVLRPWVLLGEDAPAQVKIGWTVMEPVSLAILDAAFARRVARWPEVGAVLMDRLMMRARWLALDLAISHLRRVDDRLMLLFWQLARRWGRVTPNGIVIPLALQHQLIADLIGAQRPSVTTRLGVLRDRGLITRRGDGTWLLPPSGDAFPVENLDAGD